MKSHISGYHHMFGVGVPQAICLRAKFVPNVDEGTSLGIEFLSI